MVDNTINGSVTTSVVNYIVADQLNTPRAIANSAGTTIWSWSYQGNPFGEGQPNSSNYVLNLRYPGQYYDAESGTSYNIYRNYEPATGRYLQSDPIGLDAGIDTFAYVHSAPFQHIDPLGLDDLNLFPAGSAQSAWANSVNPIPGVYTVGAHGNPLEILDQNGNPLTPDQLANMIQSDPNYQTGESVRLDSCNTGTDPGHGRLPFAQTLAFLLNASVSAPDNFGWTTGGQTLTVAPFANQPGINWQTVTQVTPNTGPDMSNQGSYIDFYPPTIPTGTGITDP